MLSTYSLQHAIEKPCSKTSFNSEDAFPNVSLSAEKLKLYINVSDSKQNDKINVTVTG